MNLKDVKAKIEIAKKAVEEEEEPIKTAAFQVIFSKILEPNDITRKIEPNSSQKTKTGAEKVSADLDDRKRELANQCNIDVTELDDVFYFKDELVQVLPTLPGTGPEKHVIAAQCILIAYDIVYKQAWVKAVDLAQCFKLSKINLLNHLARNLNKHKQSFRSQGKKKGVEYKITESGKKSAFTTVKRLAKGDET